MCSNGIGLYIYTNNRFKYFKDMTLLAMRNYYFKQFAVPTLSILSIIFYIYTILFLHAA